MTRQNPYHSQARSHTVFFDYLSAEFIARTGHGAYVYLSPACINQLYQHYLSVNQPLNRFVRSLVRQTLGE
ncbi:MAG: hypothetical protein RQ715_00140 [Methylococcales bacterium]|nr:hypothetical protein [Methylococcales bacterium]